MPLFTENELIYAMKPGAIIWRSGHFMNASNNPHNVSFRLDEVTFPPSGRGYYICRTEIIDSGVNWIYEPVAFDGSRGIVTFVKGIPPVNWTHLVVDCISPKGNAIFATPHSLDTNEYVEFRKDYYRKYLGCMNDTNQDIVQIIRGVRIGIPVNQHRMFVHFDWGFKQYLVEQPLEVRK